MNLKEYGDGELSLIVMNDEGLYNERHHLTVDYLEELGYQFTDAQWADLLECLEDEEND